MFTKQVFKNKTDTSDYSELEKDRGGEEFFLYIFLFLIFFLYNGEEILN